MRLHGIRVEPVRYALKAPVQLGQGRLVDRCGFRVRLVDENGSEGWGEALPLPEMGTEDLLHTPLRVINVFEGVVGAMADINYDFFNNGDAFLADPRVQALDDQAFIDAANEIDMFCGIDGFGTGGDGDGGGFALPPGVTIPGGGTLPPSDGTLPPGATSDELPESFPPNLEPPGVTDLVTIIAGPGYSVVFQVDSTFDEVVAYYTGEVGPPTSQLDAGGVNNATWFLPDGTIIVLTDTGTQVDVAVTGATG